MIPWRAGGIYLDWSRIVYELLTQSRKDANKKVEAKTESTLPSHISPLIFFYIPFAFLFVVSNVAKLAPWEWDNIKVLIYWFVGSLPFIALALSWAFRKTNAIWKAAAAICLVVLVASGALDVWRTVSGQINYKVFDADAVEIASQIRTRTPINAIFLNAPTIRRLC